MIVAHVALQLYDSLNPEIAVGMFDDIVQVPDKACEGCGEPLNGWQSKDSYCTLAQLPYWHVGNFYTSCRKCGMWHEYMEKKEIEKPHRPISDYELKIRGQGEPRGSLRLPTARDD